MKNNRENRGKLGKDTPRQVVEAYRSSSIDVKGSYTGNNLVNPDSQPEQDADDL